MRPLFELLVRVTLFSFILLVFWWASDAPFSYGVNLSIIVGGVLLTFPFVWVGRNILERNQTVGHAIWTTTFVHFALGFTFGIPLVRAITPHHVWSGCSLAVPSEISLALVIVPGVASLLVVINLAFKGFGAPGIARSRKLAVDWLYAWTRNPMVLAALSLFLSLGIWFQSVLFVLWVLILFTLPCFSS
jgi:protein-S-isoprenylcysteine O-methyltransferase Ste14